MKPYLILSLIALSILFLACTKKDSNHEIDVTSYKTIDITDYEKYKVETLPFKDVKYICLQSSEDFMIGDITKIRILNDRIYVFDKRYSKALFVFDISGKFLFKLENNGKGPGEYISLDDFDIDNDGNIYLLDLAAKKILKHNADSQFEKSFNYPIWTMKFKCINDDVIAFHSTIHKNPEVKNADDNTLLYWSISKDRVIGGHFPNRGDQVEFNGGDNFTLYSSDFSANYVRSYDDFIYQLTPEGLKANYKLVKRKPVISNNDINSISDDEYFKQYFEGKLGVFIHDFYETEKHIGFEIIDKKDRWILFQSKVSGNIVTCQDLRDTKNNEYILGAVEISGAYNNSFISYISGEALENYIRGAKSNAEFFMSKYGTIPIIDSLKTMSSMSNPIIFMYELNEF